MMYHSSATATATAVLPNYEDEICNDRGYYPLNAR